MKVMKKIRAVRSGVSTGVDKSGSDFWSNLPTDLMRRTAYNADVVSRSVLFFFLLSCHILSHHITS